MTRQEAIAVLESDVEYMYSQDSPYCREAYQMAIEALKAEPKRDFEVVVNEACLNCELDCVEVVRCHDCRNYEEAKNSCNGFCKEWNTSTYTWDYCSRGERKSEVEEMSEDMTYCLAECKNKATCYRNPKRIKVHNIPHSYADFSKVCMGYEQEDEVKE